MTEPRTTSSAIPFEAFTHFEPLESGNPVFYCVPPDWAAAAHAVVEGDSVHYLWARRDTNTRRWLLMHSSAPASDPAAVEHAPRNPILEPVPGGSGRPVTTAIMRV